MGLGLQCFVGQPEAPPALWAPHSGTEGGAWARAGVSLDPLPPQLKLRFHGKGREKGRWEGSQQGLPQAVGRNGEQR